jgi:hypothetical protein
MLLQNSENAGLNFREKQNKRQSPINAASNPLPESPVRLARGGVVPHIILRSSRLRLGEFEAHAAKRLLQRYPFESGQVRFMNTRLN